MPKANNPNPSYRSRATATATQLIHQQYAIFRVRFRVLTFLFTPHVHQQLGCRLLPLNKTQHRTHVYSFFCAKADYRMSRKQNNQRQQAMREADRQRFISFPPPSRRTTKDIPLHERLFTLPTHLGCEAKRSPVEPQAQLHRVGEPLPRLGIRLRHLGSTLDELLEHKVLLRAQHTLWRGRARQPQKQRVTNRNRLSEIKRA